MWTAAPVAGDSKTESPPSLNREDPRTGQGRVYEPRTEPGGVGYIPLAELRHCTGHRRVAAPIAPIAHDKCCGIRCRDP